MCESQVPFFLPEKREIECFGLSCHGLGGEMAFKPYTAPLRKQSQLRAVLSKGKNILGKGDCVTDRIDDTACPMAGHKGIASAIADNGNRSHTHALGKREGGGFGVKRTVDIDIQKVHNGGNIGTKTGKDHSVAKAHFVGQRTEFRRA